MPIAGASYTLKSSTGVCAATGRALARGEAYMATLVERDGQPALERLDFSAASWDAGERPRPPLHLFGFWRATHQPNEDRKRPLLGDAELLDLFEELGEASDAKQIRFRYLLTLLLVRRRVLKVVGSRDRAMLVVPRGPAENRDPVVVQDPGMDEAAITEAIEQLGQVVVAEPQRAAPGGQA